MQLIITQQVFVWIFGIVGVLFSIILLLVVIGLIYTVKMLKLANEKSKDVAVTVDMVQLSVRDAVHSVDSARNHIAQFFSAAVSAGTIANIVRSVRNAWQGHDTQPKPSETVEDIFNDVSIKAKPSSDKQRSS
jgi:ABC-type siderophore export system fused ATPase/permease subunit